MKSTALQWARSLNARTAFAPATEGRGECSAAAAQRDITTAGAARQQVQRSSARGQYPVQHGSGATQEQVQCSSA